MFSFTSWVGDHNHSNYDLSACLYFCPLCVVWPVFRYRTWIITTIFFCPILRGCISTCRLCVSFFCFSAKLQRRMWSLLVVCWPFSSAWEIHCEHLSRIPKSVSCSLIWRLVSGECNLITSRGRPWAVAYCFGRHFSNSRDIETVRQQSHRRGDEPVPAALWTSSVFSHPSLWNTLLHSH